MSSVLEKNENKAIVKYAQQGLHKSQVSCHCGDWSCMFVGTQHGACFSSPFWYL